MIEAIQMLKESLPLFSEKVLKINTKAGGAAVPLALNKAQRYIHAQLEDQKRRTGKVRSCVLKGRQQGASTYISARFYHNTIMNPGRSTFIFAHDASGSDSLYKMVQNYYDFSPPPMQPELGARNYKELNFSVLRSGYKVGTAGTTGLGRSKTFQNVHWSEVAYSPNSQDHAGGILQTVADVPETEIILESTANGEGDFFHRVCMQAISGAGEYELIFVPWYWQDEYTRPASDFEPDEHEARYLEHHAADGLTREHLAWRRYKIAELAGDLMRFKREYPFTPEEAFESSDEDAFIKATLVRAARSRPHVSIGNPPLVIGVDCAALGSDKFRLCFRRGRTLVEFKTYPADYPHNQARRLHEDIVKHKPALVNIDKGGLGIGVYGGLLDMGHADIVRGIDFGGTALDSESNYNRTAEMCRHARAWLEDEPCFIVCDDADAAMLQAELSGRKHKYHNMTKLRMEPKDEFKKRLGYSPDTADAFLLTFAEPLANNAAAMATWNKPFVANTNWSPW